MSLARIDAIRVSLNRLANFHLRMNHDNLGKSDGDLKKWLLTSDAGFLDRHLKLLADLASFIAAAWHLSAPAE